MYVYTKPIMLFLFGSLLAVKTECVKISSCNSTFTCTKSWYSIWKVLCTIGKIRKFCHNTKYEQFARFLARENVVLCNITCCLQVHACTSTCMYMYMYMLYVCVSESIHFLYCCTRHNYKYIGRSTCMYM